MSLTKINSNSSETIITNSSTISLLFQQMRPKQWTKNLLVFAALIFSPEVMNFENLGKSIFGFFLFAFVSSCVYIINDYVDREADSKHLKKDIAQWHQVH